MIDATIEPGLAGRAGHHGEHTAAVKVALLVAVTQVDTASLEIPIGTEVEAALGNFWFFLKTGVRFTAVVHDAA